MNILSPLAVINGPFTHIKTSHHILFNIFTNVYNIIVNNIIFIGHKLQ